MYNYSIDIIIDKFVKCGFTCLNNCEITLLLLNLSINNYKRTLKVGDIFRCDWIKLIDQSRKFYPHLNTQQKIIFQLIQHIILEYQRNKVPVSQYLYTSESLQYYVKSKIGSNLQEVFLVLLLDNNSQLIDKIVFKGTHNKAVISPKEVFREAIKYHTDHIIIAHNHPSGLITPSKEDILITQKLVEAGKYLEIKVIDHLIATKHSVLSLQKEMPGLFY